MALIESDDPRVKQIVEEAVRDAVNLVLELAATTVFRARNVGGPIDEELYKAAQRVRSLKIVKE